MGLVLGLGLLGMGCTEGQVGSGDSGSSKSSVDAGGPLASRHPHRDLEHGDLHLQILHAYNDEFSDLKPWIGTLDQALVADPNNRDLQRIRKAVCAEADERAIRDQCLVEFDLEHWQAACDCFKRLSCTHRTPNVGAEVALCVHRQAEPLNSGELGLAQRSIERMYPEPALSAAVKGYSEGKVRTSLRELNTFMQRTTDEALRQKAITLGIHMRIVKGYYDSDPLELIFGGEGASCSRMGWCPCLRFEALQALDADAMIMPWWVTSFFHEDIDNRLRECRERCGGR